MTDGRESTERSAQRDKPVRDVESLMLTSPMSLSLHGGRHCDRWHEGMHASLFGLLFKKNNAHLLCAKEALEQTENGKGMVAKLREWTKCWV